MVKSVYSFCSFSKKRSQKIIKEENGQKAWQIFSNKKFKNRNLCNHPLSPDLFIGLMSIIGINFSELYSVLAPNTVHTLYSCNNGHLILFSKNISWCFLSALCIWIKCFFSPAHLLDFKCLWVQNVLISSDLNVKLSHKF